MTDNDKTAEMTIEALFQAERAAPPEVPEGLMARVLADADAQLPAQAGPFWRDWLAGLGGLPGLGGLITASCVGFWLGIAPPNGVPDVAGQVLGTQVELGDDLDDGSLTGFGWDIGEG